ncbi:hypothetical protein [Clostridium thermobutyricum]|uniref:hypothetical protein n=1 Tax=Clostridium thermobutyricum TaxID=29372 RepID=UPI0018AB3C80|nr:hypothetical protein [Clostridium thermobutyricum]
MSIEIFKYIAYFIGIIFIFNGAFLDLKMIINNMYFNFLYRMSITFYIIGILFIFRLSYLYDLIAIILIAPISLYIIIESKLIKN